MIEFEESGRLASVASRADKRALALIPLPDSSADVRGDVTTTDGRMFGCRRFQSPALPTRTTAYRAKFSLLELRDERIECAIEQLSHVASGDCMAEQGLGLA